MYSCVGVFRSEQASESVVCSHILFSYLSMGLSVRKAFLLK